MKISYFLKRWGLVALLVSLCSSQVFAEDAVTEAALVVTPGTYDGETITGVHKMITYEDTDYTYGIMVTDGAEIGGVSGTVTVTNLYGNSIAGIYVDDTSSSGVFSGNMTMKSNELDVVCYLVGDAGDNYAVGLYSSATGDSSTFDVDWTSAKFASSLSEGSCSTFARGIYLNQEGASIVTGEGEYFGGMVYAYILDGSDSTAIGIELAQGSQMGDLASGSTVMALNQGTGNSYGIYLSGQSSIGDLACDFFIDADYGLSVAIYLEDSTMGTISGTVKAYSIYADATVILCNTEDSLQLSGATIKGVAQGAYGTAIENTSKGISIVNEGAASTIFGNLNAGEQALTFESGELNLSGDTWTASSVSIGSDSGTVSLTLESSITIDAETLNFYIHTIDELSSIFIEEGYTLNLESIQIINIYLDDAVMDAGDFELVLIDGSIDFLSDDVQVNYEVSEAYSAVSFSYSAAADGTSFIISSAGGEVVPEPCTVSLSFIALAGLLARRRRQR